MSLPPPLPGNRKAKNDWRAILVTLAYPGTGQFLQGRRAVGILLTGITTVAALWWFNSLLAGIISAVDQIDPYAPPDYFARLRVLISSAAESTTLPLKVIGLCYLISFVDAVIAHVRIAKRRNR